MQIVKKGESKNALLKSLEKVNKSLVKYGFLPGFIVSEKEIYVTVKGGTEVEKPEFPTPEIKFRGYEFVVEIPTLVVGEEGTQFIASLEFGSEEAGNRIVCGFNPEDEKAETYNQLLLDLARSRKNNCDHCNTVRTRNKLFIFQKDNQIFTIGSTCAKEWFGISIENFLKAYNSVSNFNDDEEWSGGGKWSQMRYVSEMLTYSLASIDRCGFVGSKNDNSTADDANAVYLWVHPNSFMGRAQKAPETYGHFLANREKFHSMVTEMTEWYQAFEPKSLFEHNLRSGVLDLALTSNMAPWAVRMWLDNKGIGYTISDGKPVVEKPTILESPNAYAAEVGAKKQSFRGQISFRTTLDGEFGITYMIKIATEVGDLLWYTGKFDHENCDFNDLLPGTWVEICGSVKAHSVYNDRAQTVMTRCKLSKVSE